MSVKRYTRGTTSMVESPGGEYVRYEDLEELFKIAKRAIDKCGALEDGLDTAIKQVRGMRLKLA